MGSVWFGLVTTVSIQSTAPAETDRWTAERANPWCARQPWLVGAHDIPSDAIHELEMFQASTFNPDLEVDLMPQLTGRGTQAVTSR